MKSSLKGPRPSLPMDRPAVRCSEALLRSEVAFWREMLSGDLGSLPAESVERMRQALALAEYRLLASVPDTERPEGSNEGPGASSDPGGPCLH